MGIEFMTFGTLLLLVKVAMMLVIIVTAYRIARKAYHGNTPSFVDYILIAASMLIIFMPVNLQPKITIESSPTYQQQTYKSNDEPIVIEPVAPRTETLDGFTPMSK